MQKSRMYLLLALNTAVLYATVIMLLGPSYQQALIIGIAMAMMMVAPYLIIDRELGALNRELQVKNTELDKAKRDIQAVRRQLQEVATLDEITGAFNKRHYENLVDHHRGLAERGTHVFTVCATQMDNFTELLGEFGDTKGNEMLRIIASIVNSALREVDIVARIDDYKFGIILSGASEEEAIMVVDRIGQLIRQVQVSEDNPDFQLTASTGISAFRESITVDEMLTEADHALAFAVGQGGNRVAAHVQSPTS